MPRAGKNCALPASHTGRCRTEESASSHNLRTAERQRRIAASRRVAINEWKMERGCEKCGYRSNAVALDLDHLEPETKVGDISALLRYAAWEVVVAELAKCRVLCANCHRVHTFTRAPA